MTHIPFKQVKASPFSAMSTEPPSNQNITARANHEDVIENPHLYNVKIKKTVPPEIWLQKKHSVSI
jgi:hypothetical protein